MMRYKEIKEQLIQMVGTLPPGTRLPSRPTLCKQLDTTRTTLDRAIKELVTEGVLTSQYGSGTYVVGTIKGLVSHVENWCVIVPFVEKDTFPALVRGIDNIASVSEVNIVLCNSDNDLSKQDLIVQRLLVSGVSGFIIIPVMSNNVVASYRLYETLIKAHIPFVFCNRGVEGVSAPLVKSNDFYGGHIATKLLIKRGYKRIAYFTELWRQTSIDRYQGYVSALLENGMEINRRLIVSGDVANNALFQAAKELISQEPEVDAFFCFNDTVAMEVYKAILTSGKRISYDIGVIGYDDSNMATIVSPPLSSVSYRSTEIGEAAARILKQLIRGEVPELSANLCLFQPEIVERESCLGPGKIALVHNNPNHF